MGKKRAEKRKVIWDMIEKRKDLQLAEKMLSYASSCGRYSELDLAQKKEEVTKLRREVQESTKKLCMAIGKVECYFDRCVLEEHYIGCELLEVIALRHKCSVTKVLRAQARGLDQLDI